MVSGLQINLSKRTSGGRSPFKSSFSILLKSTSSSKIKFETILQSSSDTIIIRLLASLFCEQ